MSAPLAGLRVVDSTNDGGELCGRLLADLGADVILVEPPEGSALRARHPRTPDGAHGLGFAWRNANKRGVVIDADTDTGAQVMRQLLADADVWIESAPSHARPDLDAILVDFPRLIITSITPFGLTGPYRDLVANTDTVEGFAGSMFKAGVAAKPPLLPPTALATDIASTVAAMATTMAVYQRQETGRGQHIDLSVMTAAAAAADWSYANASAMVAAGRPYDEVRKGGGFMYPIFACRDGYVRMVILSPRQWMSLWDWMGRPEAFADEVFWSQVGNRIVNADVLLPAYEEFFADKDMLDICREGQSRGIVLTPLLTAAEVLVEPHFAARGTFVTTEVAPGVTAPIASGFFEIDGRRYGIGHRAPALGEHDGARFRNEPMPSPVPSDQRGASAPLAGLRVLDFGIGGVGVEATRLLAEYGADVIKVESRKYPDFIRLVALTETSPSFVSSSRSKRSIGIDAKSPDGLALIHRLVEQSDVLVENSATGTLERMGLGRAELHELNPRLVMVSSQLVGSRGPNAHWTGYGPTTQTYGGLVHLWDYDDDDPPATNQTIFPDHLVGRLCALGAVAALVDRRRTGTGVHVEVAQVEAVINLVAERLLEEALAPGSARPLGNRSPERAPRGAYPCEGTQQWVVISVQDDQQWEQLQGVVGEPWAFDERYQTAAGRIADAAALDDHLARWTAGRTRDAVVAELQAALVPSAPMITGTEMLTDPHLQARGWTIAIDQPGIGPIELEGPAWLAADMTGPYTAPAPGLGEHTRDIAAELLGLDPATIDDLVARGILETDPPFHAGGER